MMSPVPSECIFGQKHSDVLLQSQLINGDEAAERRGTESYLAERPASLLCFLFTVSLLCHAWRCCPAASSASCASRAGWPAKGAAQSPERPRWVLLSEADCCPCTGTSDRTRYSLLPHSPRPHKPLTCGLCCPLRHSFDPSQTSASLAPLLSQCNLWHVKMVHTTGSPPLTCSRTLISERELLEPDLVVRALGTNSLWRLPTEHRGSDSPDSDCSHIVSGSLLLETPDQVKRLDE